MLKYVKKASIEAEIRLHTVDAGPCVKKFQERLRYPTRSSAAACAPKSPS